MTDLYERQQKLDLKPPHTVTIIGVGGVGSWVALDLALAGVQKLYLIDPDHIENHNLNRTPFKESQIDQDKTTALTELISERRIDTEAVPITKRAEDVAGTWRDEISESVIIDCRDHASPLPDDMDDNVAMTAGYDGYEFTLHTNPNYEDIWGEENTEYETVPSFIAPPQFVASIMTTITCSPELRSSKEQYTTQDMREMIQDLLGGREHEEAPEILDSELPEGWEAGGGERNSEEQYTKFFYKPEDELELRVYSDPGEDHTVLVRDDEKDSHIYGDGFDSEEEATNHAVEVMEKINGGEIE